MEASYRARRRMCRLASQVAPGLREDHNSARCLSAVACSAGVSAAIARRDNRLLFARQTSESQGHFMRPVQVRQVVDAGDEQGACLPAVKPGDAPKPVVRNREEASGEAPGPSYAAVAPLFGKPVLSTESYNKQVTDASGQKQGPHTPALSPENGSISKVRSSIEGSEASRPTATGVETAKRLLPDADDQIRTDSFGFEWFPRMDVVESGTAYVITIELPGVSADGIHVEVVRGSLIVTGSRATDWWKANNNGSNGGGTVYHRRELAQGPYRAVWRLPKNVDINVITAEFIDGFLRVLVPKIKIMTYL